MQNSQLQQPYADQSFSVSRVPNLQGTQIQGTNSAGYGRPSEPDSSSVGQEISRPPCDHMVLSSQEPANGPCPLSNESSSHPHILIQQVLV
jgi:hypothetical protein